MKLYLGVNKFIIIIIALFFQFCLNEPDDESSHDASMLVLLFSSYGACSGISLNKNWILVAAHCLTKDGSSLRGSSVEIAGEVDTNSKTKVRSKSIIVHEDYNEDSLLNDIALIETEDTMVSGSAQFQTEPWPENEERSCYGAEYNVQIKGRKFIHERKTYEVQAKHDRTACPCIKDQICLSKIICVTGKRACNYDTGSLGGVLICDGQFVGVARQIVDCRTCDPDKPKVDCEQSYIYRTYTYVCPYREWINKYLKSEELKPNVVCSGSKVCKDCDPNSSGIDSYNILLITSALIVITMYVMSK